MKGLLRRPAVQRLLGWTLAAYLRVIFRTVRWRAEGLEGVERVLADPGGLIVLFWHGRVPLCLALSPQMTRKRGHALISASADGEFLAIALESAGFPAIRGSSAKKGDSAKARAVVAAFRQAVTWVGDGGGLVITPDGPRGPNEVIAPGALQIAKRTGAPIFLVGLAATPAMRLKTWDQVMIALPFGRGAAVWEGPFHVEADADEARIAALAEEWSGVMSAATRRAEARLDAAT